MHIAHQSVLRTKLTQDPIKILYSNITHVSLSSVKNYLIASKIMWKVKTWMSSKNFKTFEDD